MALNCCRIAHTLFRNVDFMRTTLDTKTLDVPHFTVIFIFVEKQDYGATQLWSCAVHLVCSVDQFALHPIAMRRLTQCSRYIATTNSSSKTR